MRNGTTRTPVCVVSHAPPMPYLPFFPGQSRPLRENYYPESLLKPVFSLFDDLFQCSFTELRSMAIGLVKARPQPKNGTRNSSFLRTQTWAGNIC